MRYTLFLILHRHVYLSFVLILSQREFERSYVS